MSYLGGLLPPPEAHHHGSHAFCVTTICIGTTQRCMVFIFQFVLLVNQLNLYENDFPSRIVIFLPRHMSRYDLPNHVRIHCCCVMSRPDGIFPQRLEDLERLLEKFYAVRLTRSLRSMGTQRRQRRISPAGEHESCEICTR